MRGPVIVLVLCAICIGAMCLFPPYIREGASSRHQLEISKGYACLFMWPPDRNYNTGYSNFAVTYRVNGTQLLIQLGYTLIATIIFAVLFRRSKQ